VAFPVFSVKIGGSPGLTSPVVVPEFTAPRLGDIQSKKTNVANHSHLHALDIRFSPTPVFNRERIRQSTKLLKRVERVNSFMLIKEEWLVIAGD
jgi:hypothetical protein